MNIVYSAVVGSFWPNILVGGSNFNSANCAETMLCVVALPPREMSAGRGVLSNRVRKLMGLLQLQ